MGATVLSVGAAFALPFPKQLTSPNRLNSRGATIACTVLLFPISAIVLAIPSYLLDAGWRRSQAAIRRNVLIDLNASLVVLFSHGRGHSFAKRDAPTISLL
jgi:hypothetical protein